MCLESRALFSKNKQQKARPKLYDEELQVYL